MSGNKNKILTGHLQRIEGSQQVGVTGADAAAPASWWRSMMQGLGSKRRSRALATMQRLAHHDVEDTISEADIQGWLSMLEAQGGNGKSGNSKSRASTAGARAAGTHKSDK